MDSGEKSLEIGTPEPELRIDEDLVFNLLNDQHSELAHLPLQYIIDSGWDNAIFRLGEQWSVRLPRRQVAAKLIEHEQDWLPRLAEQLPIPVPNPYRTPIFASCLTIRIRARFMIPP